jgi:DNA-binding transcriptional regulator YiaG
MAMMPASVIATANELAKSAIDIDSANRTSLIDAWIGSRVRVRRISHRMSQREFSALLGIDQNDLAAFEAGAERINANLLFRIAKSLDVRSDYFFGGYIGEAPKP